MTELLNKSCKEALDLVLLIKGITGIVHTLDDATKASPQNMEFGTRKVGSALDRNVCL